MTQSGELHLKAVRVQDLQTGFDAALYDLQATALQFVFHCFLFLIPIGDRVRDVIDLWRGLSVANDEDVIAKRQAALLPVVF